MKLEEALTIIEQACAEFKGTLKDHQTIQQAIRLVRAKLANVEPPAAQVEQETE